MVILDTVQHVPNHGREKLQIVELLLDRYHRCSFVDQSEAHKWMCILQQPRVSRYGLKTLLCIFWNSPGVLHDRVSIMRLMATSYAKCHKLTKVARNYCSHYDKTSENCGPLRLEENALKHTANQRKTTFLH